MDILQTIKGILAKKSVLYVSVSVIFTIVWIGNSLDYLAFLGDFALLLIVLLPVLLLFSVVASENSFAFFGVISFFVFTILHGIDKITSFYYSYIEYGGEGLARICSCNPYDELIFNLQCLCLSFIALGLMHNKTLTTLFKWTLPKLLLAIAFGCLVFLLKR